MNGKLRVAVLVALVAVLGLGGCVRQWVPLEPPSSPIVPLVPPASETAPPVTPNVPSTPVPIVTPTLGKTLRLPITGGETDRLVVSPAYFEFGNVTPTSTIDTWTSDGYITVGNYKVNYPRGEPLCLIIFNDSPYEYTYELEAENAPEEVNWCEATQKNYAQSPVAVNLIIAIGEPSFTLQSGEAKAAAFSIQLRDVVEYPNQWECRISVVGLAPGGVQKGVKIRVFVYMR